MIVEISTDIMLQYLGYVSDNLKLLKPKLTKETIDQGVAYTIAEANLNVLKSYFKKAEVDKAKEEEEDMFRAGADFKVEVKDKFIKEAL